MNSRIVRGGSKTAISRIRLRFLQESAGEHETSSSSSGASSPVIDDPREPFEPKYLVKVTDPIKNGDILQYTLKTTQVSDSCDFSVIRRYEDFEFLHHCLLTQKDTDGIIMPPIPAKPVVEAKEAEQKSKKYLGSTAKALIGDEFHKDCRSLEKYLHLIIKHKVLGRSSCLDSFLTQTQAPTGVKLKRGLFGKLLNAADEARKTNHVDIEDHFQKARTNANDFSNAVQQSSCAFNQVVHSQQRVALAYAQLSSALKSCNTTVADEMNSDANRLLVKFSDTIDDAKHGVDVEISNDENTLGFWLDLYARYSLSVKEMLYRRTCLMIDYEESNRNLDKAKLGKKQLAEETKMAAEKAFEKCSEVAQRELVAFSLQRRATLQETLCVYADAKIKTARDTFALLAKSLTYFKQADRASSGDVNV